MAERFRLWLRDWLNAPSAAEIRARAEFDADARYAEVYQATLVRLLGPPLESDDAPGTLQ